MAVYYWTDVVDTLPRSGLVGWCPESVFFADEHSYSFYPAPAVKFGNRERGQRKAKTVNKKGTLAHVTRKVATALFNESETCLKIWTFMCICSNFSRRGLPRKLSLIRILTFLFCCNFYSLEAVSKPALKPPPGSS